MILFRILRFAARLMRPAREPITWPRDVQAEADYGCPPDVRRTS